MDRGTLLRYNRAMAAANLTRALLDRHLAEGRGSAVAVVEGDRSWTYSELLDRSARVGAALTARGLRPGDRIALFLHDTLEWAAVFLGAVRVGAMPVPIAELLRLQDIKSILADARPKLAIVHRELASLLEDVCDELPQAPEILGIGGTPDHPDLDALSQRELPALPVDGSGPAMLLYSGGASGLSEWVPRAVPHTAEAIASSFDAWAVNVLDITASDRVLSTAKLSSAYGLGAGLLFPLLAGGTAILLPERARPRIVFEVMARSRPTVFAATPSLYSQMLHDYGELAAPRAPLFEGVRVAVSGAEPLPAGLWRRIKSRFGIEVVHGFGATEALHFFISSRPGDIKPGAAGRLLDGFEARLVGEEGQPVGVEEIGELEIRGPSVATGYFRTGPEAQHVFREGGWLHTGDRFFVDRDGWYFHCGRTDDLFKVSGKWVSPSEVENTLLSHPAVWECAVVGQEDGDGLMIPVAYVVPNVGFEATIELGRELMEFVKREIAPYKYPRKINFIAELPKSTVGKVQRWRLRAVAQ